MNTSTLKSSQVTYLQVSADQAGRRIDNFLHAHLKGVPRALVYRILRTGEVRVNKGRIKPAYRLQTGDKIRLPPIDQWVDVPRTPAVNHLKALENAILYEDRHLLVIDKPAGMAVHGGSGVSYGVIEGLRALYPKAPFLELVHRLDRETSGCLMIAKKSSLLRYLHEKLRRNEITKQYIALVQGSWPVRCAEIDVPLRKNIVQSGERVVRVSVDGKPALTQFQIIQSLPQATLLKIHPLTGRTHQIRVHATFAGHPIAGDDKYGDAGFNRQMRAYGLTRLFLHAAQLDIELPDNKHLILKAALPKALEQILQHLAHAL